MNTYQKGYIITEISGATTVAENKSQVVIYAENIGNGIPVYDHKSGRTLYFNTLHAGANINIATGVTGIFISSTASGSTGATGGTITGATNGLSLFGGGKQTGLGGTLTGDTYVDTIDGNQSLSIGTVIPLGNFNTIAQYQQRFSLTGDTSFLQLAPSNIQLSATYAGGPTSLIFANTSNAGLLYTNASNINSNIAASDELASISVTNNNNGDNAYIRLRPNGSSSGITVSSTIHGFKGMVYGADYGDNFGPRSIPDVQWVRDNATTNFNTLTAETLTFKSPKDVYAQQDIISTDENWFVGQGLTGDAYPDNDTTFCVTDETQTILLFGTLGGGLYIVDYNTYTTTVHNSSSGTYTGDAIPNNITKAIWIGTDVYYTSPDFSGFGRFDTVGLVNTRFTPSSGNYAGNTITNAVGTNLVFDGIDDVYYLANNAGLVRYTISTNTIHRYNVVKDNYSGDTINNLVRDIVAVGQQIWFTTNGGLFLFDPNDFSTAPFPNITRFANTSGNYSGDLFISNALSAIAVYGTELYLTGYRFDTASYTNQIFDATSKGDNYSGDTLIPASQFYLAGDILYMLGSTGLNKFNLATKFNRTGDVIEGYINNDFSGSRIIYADPLGNIFTTSQFLITKTTSSAGIGIVDASPSPFELRFDEHGLRYTSDQSSYFTDRNLVDKGYVTQSIDSAVGVLNTQIDAIENILTPYEQSARPPLTTFGRLHFYEFSANTSTYLVTNNPSHMFYSSGVYKLQSGPGNFSEYAYLSNFNQPVYSGDSTNCFEFWKIRIKMRFTSTVGGTTYGLSLGMQSTNNYSKIDMAARLAADSNNFFFYSLLNGSPSQQTNGSYSALVANTIYFYEVERIKNRLVARVYNSSNTMLGSGQIDYNISLSGNTFWSNNCSRPVIYNHGGNIDILNIEVTSNHTVNSDVVMVGDSNMHGLYIYSNVNRARYCEQAASSLGLTYNIFAGIDQGTRDIQKYQRWISLSNPKYVYINCFSNDIASATGFSTQYNSLVTYCKNNGIRVIHGSPIARNYDASSAYSVINAAGYSGDTKVDLFQATKMYNSNALRNDFNAGDYIHQNEWGNNACAERLMFALLKEESKTILFV